MSLFPSPCLLCGKAADDSVCPECLARLSGEERLQRFSLPYLEGALTLFDYGHKSLMPLLFAAKDRGDHKIVLFFARLYAARRNELCAPIDLVTFAPRRKSSVWKNGFDQSAMLSEDFAALCGLPWQKVLRRRGFSRRQHGLAREARMQNAKNKFCVCRNVRGKTILLIDDVITTGATVASCAQALKEAGAAQVYAMALFRGGVL